MLRENLRQGDYRFRLLSAEKLVEVDQNDVNKEPASKPAKKESTPADKPNELTLDEKIQKLQEDLEDAKTITDRKLQPILKDWNDIRRFAKLLEGEVDKSRQRYPKESFGDGLPAFQQGNGLPYQKPNLPDRNVASPQDQASSRKRFENLTADIDSISLNCAC